MKLTAEMSLFNSLFDAIPFGIYVADVNTYEVIFVNKAFKSATKNLIGKKCYKAIYYEESPCHFCNIKQLLNEKNEINNQTLIHEKFNEVNDRWYQLQDKCIGWPDGRIAKYSIAVDITELKEVQNSLAEAHAELALKTKMLEVSAITDRLTKIYNRVKLEEVFDYEMSRSNRGESTFSVMILDIDKFKNVNDEYGHLVGDKVLIEFAQILKEQIRTSDTLGRWGGEEFMIICPGTHETDAIKLAEKLRQIIDQYEFTTVGNKTASFGISFFKEGDTDDALVERADKALYQAKNNGRNQVVSF